MNTQYLSEDQLQHFIRKGYLILEDCFSKESAKAWTNDAFARLGYDPNDSKTWKEALIHMPPERKQTKMRDFSPKAWQAICDLLGGVDRVKDADDLVWNDAFVVNFHYGADRPWQPPSPQVEGWHKDGGSFIHFLDSPEMGLLLLVYWSDVAPQGGGTFLACDSLKVVAKQLYDNPQGIISYGGFDGLIHECQEFVELTGQAGTVALVHPFLLHTSSQNMLGIPRFLTNPAIALHAPMNFNRKDSRDYSPVEQAILSALNIESLDFKPTAARESWSYRISQRLERLEYLERQLRSN